MQKIAVSLALSSLVWAADAAAADPPQAVVDPNAPSSVTVTTPSATTTVTGTPTMTTTTTTTSTVTPPADEASTTTTTSAETDAIATTTAPPPPRDTPAPETREWVNRPLLVTGSVLLVASYVPMAVTAYVSDRPADQTNLYYPVVGPWMNLADRQCDVRACNNEGLNKALLIADGIGQGLGALAVVTSLFLPNNKTSNWYLIGSEKTHAGPTRVGSGYGFGAAGHF